MKKDSEDWSEVPQLRSLRRLVSALTFVLIFGMFAVAATLIWRISTEPGSATTTITAEEVNLPKGEAVTSVGANEASLSFMTKDTDGVERLRVFDAVSGQETGVVEIKRAD